VIADREVADPAAPRFLTGYAALTVRLDTGERPFVMPTTQLHEIPRPVATRNGDVVTLSWAPFPEDVPRALTGYAIYLAFSTTGPWRRLGQTTGTSFDHVVQNGCAGIYALRLRAGPYTESVAFSVAVEPDGPNADSDGDFLPDACDNCPDEANPAQADWNHDGLGDTCDDALALIVQLHVEKRLVGGVLQPGVVLASRDAVGPLTLGVGYQDPWFQYSQQAMDCDIRLRPDGTYFFPVPAAEDWMAVAATPGRDWGTDSLGNPRPDTFSPCP
jgi:hypothetical protein